MPKRPAKARVAPIIARVPDESSVGEKQHTIGFVRMIERGVRDADAGHVVSHEEVVRETKSWSK